MILGIAGTIGAGKGSLVKFLEAKGFTSYSSSKLLRALVYKEGNPATREFLSLMATSLQTEYPGGVVEKNYREKYLAERPENAVFEAIHRKSEAEFLRSVGGYIIGIDADLKLRYQRTTARNEGEKDRQGLENFIEQSRIEDEGEGDATRDNNIRAVLELADAVILNNGTLVELHEKIDKVLHKIFLTNNVGGA